MENINNPQEDVLYKKIKPTVVPERNIGVDTSNTFISNIAEAGLSSMLDLSALENFSAATQSRSQIYDLVDTMCDDSIVAAILETYAEDATEYNDEGRIVWCESDNSTVSKYVNYLLDTMNIDKNIYKWMHSLCKYGDLYLRLYRESEYDDPLFSKEKEDKKELNEDINIMRFSKNDKYVHYVEMIPDPAEVFELTRFGKTYGYIRAHNKVRRMTKNSSIMQSFNQYKFNRNDVDVFGATEFVHACLDDNSNRTPEEVSIFISDSDNKEQEYTYGVKRGQSILYNAFKIWRQLSLLEQSVLLNRITKSSIVRVIGVEVKDMPKENVGPHLSQIKSLVEQKSALNTDSSMSEYNNPGPVENNIYVPTRDGQGALSIQNIGGDVDVKSLSDLDYFKNRFYGCLRGNTSVKLSDGDEIKVEDACGDSSIIGKKTYSCNSDGTIEEATITDVFITKQEANFIRISFEDGTHVDVTEEHKMMLADGTFKLACELTEEDELMSI